MIQEVRENCEIDETMKQIRMNQIKKEKEMIRIITKLAATKNFFCQKYVQGKYIEYRSCEYPFQSFRYTLSHKNILE